MYLTAAIVAIISLIYLDISNYVYSVLNSNIEPKNFYYASVVIVAPLLLSKFRKFVLYMASPFSLWVFAEIIIHSYGLLDGNEATVHLIMVRDQYLILSLLFGFTASIARTESYNGIFRILAITIPVLVIIDFVSPGIFYPIGTEGAVQGRAAAMYINPTRAGQAILLTCLLAIPVMRLQYRMPLLLLAGAGIIVTFSRGPTLVWVSFLLFLLITRKLPKYSFVFPLVAFAVLPLSISIFKSYIQERQDLDFGSNNILERLDFFQTQSLNDDSAQQRMAVLEAGWRIFLDNPIFGAGTGITSFQSNFWPLMVNTHNQIALVAAEQGIIGIALWVWLLVILWRGRYFQDTSFQLAAAVGTFFMSFFTHNMFDTLYWLMTFALVSGRRREQA
jgi:O-antigen ligase